MSKRWLGALVLVVFAFLLVAWGGGSKEIVGNQFDTEKVKNITKGKTTKDECVKMFGKHTNKGIDTVNNWEWIRWRYEERKSKGFGGGLPFVPGGGSAQQTEGQRYTLQIWFDQNSGIVKNFNYEEEDLTTKGAGGGM